MLVLKCWGGVTAVYKNCCELHFGQTVTSRCHADFVYHCMKQINCWRNYLNRLYLMCIFNSTASNTDVAEQRFSLSALLKFIGAVTFLPQSKYAFLVNLSFLNKLRYWSVHGSHVCTQVEWRSNVVNCFFLLSKYSLILISLLFISDNSCLTTSEKWHTCKIQSNGKTFLGTSLLWDFILPLLHSG